MILLPVGQTVPVKTYISVFLELTIYLIEGSRQKKKKRKNKGKKLWKKKLGPKQHKKEEKKGISRLGNRNLEKYHKHSPLPLVS